MANEEQLRILKQGAAAWNQWRGDNKAKYVDLRGADLRNLDLVGNWPIESLLTHPRGTSLVSVLNGVHLWEAHLEAADLRGARLIGANLMHANLHGAKMGIAGDSRESPKGDFLYNWSGTDLSGAHLNDACLARASLSNAILVGANLTGADLDGTDLRNAMIGNTVFADVDLSASIGLETVHHHLPSIIGIEAIYRSQGKIPEAFLRGAGMPEIFIANMHSLIAAMSPIDFYSCFISYSSKDHEFATRLHADLQSKGVRCWFAPENLKIGAKLRSSFDEAIRLHDKLMVILSESSVVSQWVEKEVETAFEKERKQSRTVFFPICVDDAVMETDQPWAADIRRTRHIGDFRDWKNHDSYKKGFDRLLRDLRTEGKTESSVHRET